MPQDSSSPLPEVHPPTLEEVLEGLRETRDSLLVRASYGSYADHTLPVLDRAIAFLESPERAFRCRDCSGPVVAL